MEGLHFKWKISL